MKYSKILYMLGGSLTLAVFAVDLNTDPGIAVGIAYILPLLLGLIREDHRYFITFGLAASVFLLIDIYFFPGSEEFWISLLNLVYYLGVIWVVIFLCFSIQRHKFENRDFEEELAKRVAERTEELSRVNWELQDELKSRQWAEETLADQETRIRAVLDNVLDVIISINQWGEIDEFNRAAEKIFGYTKKEVIGKNVSMLAPEPYAREHDLYIQRYLKTGNAKVIGMSRELEGLRKDGTIFPMVLGVTEVMSCGDKMFVGIIKDISQQKKAEREKEALLHEFQKVNKELEDFAYVVSHDLKAPLRGISSLADWLVQDYAESFDEDGREQARLLIARTERMSKLISGILEISRIGRDKRERKLIDSGKVARQVIDSLEQPGGIKISTEGEFPKFEFPESHLIQLFQNLISNAMTHMNKPDGKVVVSCKCLGEFWEFCVRDNGVGIEKKHFDRIFKVFQTLKPKDDSESTGIGLSIVKKIVENYGGTVRVESEYGKGCAFFCTLPKSLDKKKPELDSIQTSAETSGP